MRKEEKIKIKKFYPMGFASDGLFKCCECPIIFYKNPSAAYQSNKFVEITINEYCNSNRYEIRLVLCQKCFDKKINNIS